MGLQDSLPDIDGGDVSEQTKQVLLPTYWRKDIAGAWRMYVDVNLVDSDNMAGEGDNSN